MRKAPPPQLILGDSYYHPEKRVFLDDYTLRQHLYLLGKTGTGKSTLLLSLLSQWIDGGMGATLIDPHGELVDELLPLIPKHRTNEVLLIEPGDYAVSWNPLYRIPLSQRARVASGLVEAFRGIFSDSWGPRLEYILTNALRLVLDAQEESLLGVLRLLTDKPYRETLLLKCSDPTVRNFWIVEFGSWNSRFRSEAISPLQNKLGQVLGDPVLRRILGARKNKVDLGKLIDERFIILVNLSKGSFGPTSSRLLGSLLVSGFEQAAFSRSRDKWGDTYILAVDEFAGFMTGSFATLLGEIRKYGLALALSHQHCGQLMPTVRDAIIGNVGSHILFRLGGGDAELFAREFGHPWDVSRFTALRPFHAASRITRKSDLEEPAIVKTLPVSFEATRSSETIRKRSNERFARKGHQIDTALESWL